MQVVVSEDRWAKALQRAILRLHAIRPTELYRLQGGDGVLRAIVFAVPSAKNRETQYEVTYHTNGEVVCTCQAGEHGVPCWHAALVWYVMTSKEVSA